MTYTIHGGCADLKIGDLELALDPDALRQLAQISTAAAHELDGQLVGAGAE